LVGKLNNQIELIIMVDKLPNQPLKSKLFIPHIRNGLVLRPRLTRLIKQSPWHRLTLLSAPPGFGKTTVLAEWAAQTEVALAWVSLDAGDNDPARFLSCLVAALEQIQRVGPDTYHLFQSTVLLPPVTVLEALLSELEANLDPFTVVLDDYHLIQASLVHEILVFLRSICQRRCTW
jgi:LuxR family transcriptional regulator, maltose regulon positive regulatory protein